MSAPTRAPVAATLNAATVLARFAGTRRAIVDGIEYVSAYDVLGPLSESKNVRQVWHELNTQYDSLLAPVRARIRFEMGADGRRAVDSAALPLESVRVLIAIVPGMLAARTRIALLDVERAAIEAALRLPAPAE